MEPRSPAHLEARAADLTDGEPREEGRLRLPLIGQRRTLLIDPRYQLRAMALPTLISVGTVTALIFTLFRVLMSASLEPAGTAQSVWQTREAYWLLNSLACALAFAALLVLVGLVETHRAAGAIFKMQRHVARVAGGDLKAKVMLRKSDHFQDFAVDFNHMLENLREEARIDLHEVNQAIEALGQVRPVERDEASTRLARAWDSLVELKHRKERSAH